MFTVDKILKFVETIHEIRGARFTYKYRRLDGVDRFRIAGLKEFFQQVKYVIANCLLDHKTEKPIGDAAAYQFIRGDYDDALTVFGAIMDASGAQEQTDEADVDAAKNESSATAGASTKSDIVNDSESTPEVAN